MRKLIISFSLLLVVALSIKAASLHGIRIENTENPVIIFVDGEQVSTPTMSCFIANLNPGNYRIEVYEVEPIGRNDRERRGDLLYDNIIYFSGNGIKNICIDGNYTALPSPPRKKWDGIHSNGELMDNNTFNCFFSAVKDAPFKSDKMSLIETAVRTSAFTSKQCKRLIDLNTFDDDKIEMLQMLYPRVIDRQHFFMLIESLTFISSKDKMNDFIKEYNNRYN